MDSNLSMQAQMDAIRNYSDFDISVYIQDKYLECRKNIRKLPINEFITLSLYINEWELRVKRGIIVDEPHVEWISMLEEEQNREPLRCPNIKLLRAKFDMEVEEESSGGAKKKHKMKLKQKESPNGRKKL